MMKKDTPSKPDCAPADLERRLVRYRSRVASEGRTSAVREIDKAIEEGKQAKPARGGE